MSSAATDVTAYDRVQSPFRPIGAYLNTAEQPYKGWFCGVRSDGTIEVARERAGYLGGGFATRTILGAPTGNNTDAINLETGIFSVQMLTGDEFQSTDGPRPIYSVSNAEFGRSPSNASTDAQRSIVGCFLSLDPDRPTTYCIAWLGPEGVAMASALQLSQGTAVRDRCRGVFTNLGGTTTYASGVLTGPANTALSVQDGISSPAIAVGDVFWAQKGLANLPAAAQAGPWQIASLGSGSSPWVAIRPWWYQSGSTIPFDFQVRIGPEGTGPLASTVWMAFCAPGKVVDTDDPLFWPQTGRVGATLSTGGVTAAITTVPVRSWPGSRITFTPSTLASDGTVTLWRPTSVTPGPIGTATFTITGESAAGTAVSGARTVGEVEVQNW